MDILQLAIAILINSIDIVMIYYLCHRLINKRIKLSLTSIICGLAYGASVGTLAHYVNIDYIDINIFRAISMSLVLIILKCISKKGIADLLLINFMIMIVTAFAQFPALLVLELVPINQDYYFLIGQILASIVILLIGFKVPIHKLFSIIERQLLFKLIIFLFAFFILGILLYINLEQSIAYLVYTTLFILLVGIGLSVVLMKISFYTTQVPEQLHDVKNVIAGLQISAYTAANLEDVQKELENMVRIIGGTVEKENLQMGDPKSGILKFISQKQTEKAPDLTFVTEVNYYEHHHQVPVSVIIYMLGILLDNAIESETKYPIIIKVSVAEESLDIIISNQCEREVTDKIEAIFQKRYSTKPGEGRGYGLANLQKIVQNYNGKIGINYAYNEEYTRNYLTFSIRA